ncbi:MAG: hypothetical protein WC882_05270 [Candidatus Gracilibacteria bacterium]
MDDQNQNTPNPIEGALKQIQNWFVSGDFEKVKQGCEEILHVAPNNSIAQDLLKKADEKLGKTTEMSTSEPSPIPSHEMPIESIPGMPPDDIDDDLISSPTGAVPPEEMQDLEDLEKKNPSTLFINLLILAGLFILGIGLVYGYETFIKDSDQPVVENTTTDESTDESTIDETIIDQTTPDEIITDETPPTETENTATTRNEKRLIDLETIEKALIEYYDANKQYPTADTINTVLVEQGFLSELPLPLKKDIYTYAVYENTLGPNQDYILSAPFENDDKTIGSWTTGGNRFEHADYNDLSQPNVTILDPTMTEEEYLNQTPAEETPTENTPDDNGGRIHRT